ncbi:hypothetical protein [Helicobacter fennelliae]|uniref:Uncharacterized protein n=2 Tax=Helicobacter fennelliae TaxID=215 RepID=T1CWG8_9HELI|nr:hypothetical protein [Helicobacter fennelliae]GAD18200.1 hypothetical protein HFN_1798 [Helicobacter fennelliae MRY12-0050]SQB98006.1 Uncharacterised protein [Helicobacter fennelliae]STP06784.1 Uncharacterised protein [Helicobacter fennelliae]STQ83662.1 Uncharacterised protein [Helicobacter fennelliae]
MRLDYKRFSIAFIVLFGIMSVGAFCVNYYADMYGLRDSHHKRLANLVSTKTHLYKPRLEAKASYYTIGSSRFLRINISRLADELHSHTISSAISSITSAEILFIAKQFKKNNVHLIVGLDAFSLNTQKMVQNNRFEEALHTNTLPYWTNLGDFLILIKEKITDFVFQRNTNYAFEQENKQIAPDFTFEKLEQTYFGTPPQKNYLHYFNYTIDLDEITELAKIVDSKDIFIIFPKHAMHYELFEKYGIKEQYFKAIETLVKNTKARVISFYGVNEITSQKDNFDTLGWHFKPKIGGLILDRIFQKGDYLNLPNNFGVELNASNIDSYLQAL